MKRWLEVLIPLGLASSACPAAVTQVSAQTRTFEGWTATCDNLKSCVVLATAQDDIFYVRIARAAGATAAPEVKIVLAAEEPQKGGAATFRLGALTDGTRVPLGPFPAAVADDDSSIRVASLPPGEKSLAFIEAIRNASTLEYAVLTAHGSLDLKGLAAALRFIDAAQGRQGTPTALVARGMTPISQVAPPPEPPVVVAAPMGSAAVVDKPIVTKTLSDLASAVCDPDVVKDQSEAMAWRLGADKVLVAVSCTQGAYNLGNALYLTRLDGSEPKAVALPRPVPLDADEAANVVVNASFDPKTMELTSLDKGRGLGDCGTSATWVWDGQSFALFEAAALENCPGSLPEDWPRLYSAKRK